MTEAEAMEKLDHFDTTHLQPLDDVYDEHMYPIKSFLKYIENIQTRIDEYKELLSWCDQAREDILHYQEFNNPNAAERAKLFRKLTDIQKTRRVVKTHLECLMAVNEAWVANNTVSLHKNGAEAMKRLNGLSKRKYTNRTSVVSDTLGQTKGGDADEAELG